MRSCIAAAVHILPSLILSCCAIGCSSPPTTKVDFVGPSGSVITIDHKAYPLPATVALPRPSEKGKTKRQDVELYVPAVQVADGVRVLDAEGVIDVFGYAETDVDRLATNTCNFSNEELLKILDGYAVIFDGTSPSSQKLYHMILGKKKRVAETTR
jgi:hypothetical protein